MTTLLAAAVLLGAAGFLAWAAFRMLARLEQLQSKQDSLALLQQQLESLRGQVAQSLLESQKLVDSRVAALNQDLNARLSEVARANETVGGALEKRLSELGQHSQRILDVGAGLADLQSILKGPKLRGLLGEFLLEDLLAQVLPPAAFEMQHRFRSGETVDAVVRLGDRLVPVDSKFPLESFRRMIEAAGEDEKRAARKEFASSVKKHIDAVRRKYIVTDEGTYPFALMYIPAESVYYEIVQSDGSEGSLLAYAQAGKVVPVSPNTLFAYLQVIVLGLRGLKVEEQARAILEHLDRLRADLSRFSDAFRLVGTHLGNAQKAYVEGEKRLGKMEDKLSSLKEGSAPPIEREAPPAMPHAGGIG